MRRGTKFRTNLNIQETSNNNSNNNVKIPSLALGALGLIVVCGGAYALYNTCYIGGKKQLPPGPRPWAVYGTSMHLGTIPCQAMAKLCSCNYGGIMTIYTGNIPTIIITSSKIAVQVFNKMLNTFQKNYIQFIINDMSMNYIK